VRLSRPTSSPEVEAFVTLRRRRLAANLRAIDVARLAATSLSTLSLIERGLKIPGPDLLQRIERALEPSRNGAAK
jgi:transcriptional regulator with XRE-family HTH domain